MHHEIYKEKELENGIIQAYVMHEMDGPTNYVFQPK